MTNLFNSSSSSMYNNYSPIVNTVDPNFNLFKNIPVVPKRYSITNQYLPLNSNVTFGSNFDFICPNNIGSILYDIMLSVRLPKLILDCYNHSIKAAWCKKIGFALIQSIEVYVDEVFLERHTGENLSIIFDYNYNFEQKLGLNSLIGNEKHLYSFDHKNKRDVILYIPLLTWLNKNNPFPLFSLRQNRNMRFRIQLTPLCELLNYTYGFCIEDLNLCDCYMYTSTSYLNQFDELGLLFPNTMLFDQILNFTDIIPVDDPVIIYNLTGRVKQIIWYIKRFTHSHFLYYNDGINGVSNEDIKDVLQDVLVHSIKSVSICDKYDECAFIKIKPQCESRIGNIVINNTSIDEVLFFNRKAHPLLDRLSAILEYIGPGIPATVLIVNVSEFCLGDIMVDYGELDQRFCKTFYNINLFDNYSYNVENNINPFLLSYMGNDVEEFIGPDYNQIIQPFMYATGETSRFINTFYTGIPDKYQVKSDKSYDDEAITELLVRVLPPICTLHAIVINQNWLTVAENTISTKYV